MALRAKIDRRVLDPMEFDRAVVRGAIEVYNATQSDERRERGINTAQWAQPFDWLPGVLKERARRAGLNSEQLHWSDALTSRDIVDMHLRLLFMIGAGRLAPGGSISFLEEGSGWRRISKEAWYREIVESLQPVCGWRVLDGRTTFVVIPALTDLAKCIAYAIVVIQMKGLESLIRPCGFLRSDVPESLAHHYFLADDPRQKFCLPEHANAYRQRQWRREHSTGRRPK